jgi:MYXO-CTERM domain-containing protein
VNRFFATTIAVFVFITARAEAADRCAAAQVACGADECCGSNQVCCSQTGVCCDIATAYCCPDGSCSAAPSGCGVNDAPKCPAYQVACGGLCLVAGSDCCSDNGNHCPPTETCRDANSCMASGQTHPARGKDDSAGLTTKRLTPTDDPAGLKRTCAVVRVADADRTPTWPMLALGLLGLLRWRVTRRRGASLSRDGVRSATAP